MSSFTAQPQREDLFEIVDVNVGTLGLGLNYTFTVADNAKVEIISLNYYFITDATVASRYAGVQFRNPGGILTLYLSTTYSLAASKFKHFSWTTGVNARSFTTSSLSWDHPLPRDFYLFHNWTFATYIGNIQAGDQIQNLFLRYKRWIIE